MIKVASFLKAGSEFLDLMESLLCKSSIQSYSAELLSSFIFVFAGVGSAMSSSSLLASSEQEAVLASSSEVRLLMVAVAHAFAMSSAVSLSAHISGGHVNPAVTFGLLLGGHIRVFTALCYIVAQLLGSSLACAVLSLCLEGQAIPIASGSSSRISITGGLVVEGIATFAVVCTVYAARDPMNGPRGITGGPIVIGFIHGANIIVTAPFTGRFMNPGRSFGLALMSGDFRNHWVCWVGPFLGGGLAGMVYRCLLSQSSGTGSGLQQDDDADGNSIAV
ncbi:hypothetical protein SAY87_009403 [Trapa incisa]|uniref:Uncharacterized protein n=1 Tax=Trapa incisa TaxID=236973 RepID=A0AAN7JWI3_9MYRT|nr:hypothetical protein SAY87_009403 [Trapa incisa]